MHAQAIPVSSVPLPPLSHYPQPPPHQHFLYPPPPTNIVPSLLSQHYLSPPSNHIVHLGWLTIPKGIQLTDEYHEPRFSKIALTHWEQGGIRDPPEPVIILLLHLIASILSAESASKDEVLEFLSEVMKVCRFKVKPDPDDIEAVRNIPDLQLAIQCAFRRKIEKIGESLVTQFAPRQEAGPTLAPALSAKEMPYQFFFRHGLWQEPESPNNLHLPYHALKMTPPEWISLGFGSHPVAVEDEAVVATAVPRRPAADADTMSPIEMLPAARVHLPLPLVAVAGVDEATTSSAQVTPQAQVMPLIEVIPPMTC